MLISVNSTCRRQLQAQVGLCLLLVFWRRLLRLCCSLHGRQRLRLCIRQSGCMLRQGILRQAQPVSKKKQEQAATLIYG
jgi:hypothetical protein